MRHCDPLDERIDKQAEKQYESIIDKYLLLFLIWVTRLLYKILNKVEIGNIYTSNSKNKAAMLTST